MLTDEITKYRTFRDPYKIEKDYLQDLVLYFMYANTANELVFKGGTALSKFYHSDRFSEDLDFTIRNSSKPAYYINELLDDVIANIQYKTAYDEMPKINKFGTISASIMIEGPRYNGKQSTLQRILFEINTKASLLLEPVAFPRAPVYADAGNYVALVMDKTEILSEKVRAMMSSGRRHRERDLYDIYYLLGKKTRLDKRTIIEKLKESGIVLHNNSLLKSIGSIRQTWGSLEPFVQHRLEDYAYVAGIVKENFEKEGLL